MLVFVRTFAGINIHQKYADDLLFSPRHPACYFVDGPSESEVVRLDSIPLIRVKDSSLYYCWGDITTLNRHQAI